MTRIIYGKAQQLSVPNTPATCDGTENWSQHLSFHRSREENNKQFTEVLDYFNLRTIFINILFSVLFVVVQIEMFVLIQSPSILSYGFVSE